METAKNLQLPDIVLILTGIAMGSLGRIITLRVDFRQNPSFPNGFFINIVAGFIASTLGAVAIPALMAMDFTAVTFLAVGIQLFREIRQIEAESLGRLEHTEYTKRGDAYIDGIAKTYEARNYISLITALATVFVMKIFFTKNLVLNCIIGFVTGLILIYLMMSFTKGKSIGDICRIREGKITVEGSDLYVDGMFVTNTLGTELSKYLFLNEGVALVIEPTQDIFRLTIENSGQRQAMLYEAARSFGVKRYNFTKRDLKEGKVILAFVPIIRNVDLLIKAVSQTPILENSRKVHAIMSTPKGGRNNGKST